MDVTNAAPAYCCRLRVSQEAEVIGDNTNFVPDTLDALDFPPRVSPGMRVDGSWGPHEYSKLPQLFCDEAPYMAWIPVQFDSLPIPHFISLFDFHSEPAPPQFIPTRAWPSRGSVAPDILDKFQADTTAIYVAVLHAFNRVQSNKAVGNIQLPLRALERTYASLLALRVNFLTCRDVLEYASCLKRSVAELQGFLLWVRDLDHWLDPLAVVQSRGYVARGVVCEDLSTYNNMRRMGLPVWCFVSGLPPNVSTATNVLAATSFAYPGWSASVLQNKALFFYPPVVSDGRDFELAARGYKPREDTLRRDKGYRKDLGAMEDLLDKIKREGNLMTEPAGKFTFL